MTRFEDGPAKDAVLMLKRAPRFLRAVFGGGEWDALDQLDDKATPDELICAYEITGSPGMCHILRRPTGSGWFVIANYRFVPEQPTDAEMRSNEAWRKWCEAHK